MKKEQVISNNESVQPIEIKDYQEVKQKVNEARKEFVAKHNQIMKINKIVSGVFFVIAIGLAIAAYFVPDLIGLMIGLVCGTLAVLWFFTRLQRKKIDLAVADYLYAYSINCNSYLYKQEEVKDITIEYRKNPDVELVKKINISNEYGQIAGRELVNGKLTDKDFIAADISLKVGKSKRQRDLQTLFVGKAYFLDYSLKGEGRILLYQKGCGDAAPTKLEDVNKVEVEKLKPEWEVYSSYNDYEKLFDSKLIKVLNKISCDEIVNDIVISFVNDKVIIGFSYCDEAMIIPMNNEFETKYFEHKVDDFKQVIEINKVLMSNSQFKK